MSVLYVVAQFTEVITTRRCWLTLWYGVALYFARFCTLRRLFIVGCTQSPVDLLYVLFSVALHCVVLFLLIHYVVFLLRCFVLLCVALFTAVVLCCTLYDRHLVLFVQNCDTLCAVQSA